MNGTASIKQKEMFNLYWIAEAVIAVVGLVNLLVIKTEYPRASAIVNLIFLVLAPLIFVLGYLDYKNYDPLTPKKEFLYCAAGTAALWISLIEFNVRNYNVVLSDFLEDPFYNKWVSALAALFFAVGVMCAILSAINRAERKRLAIYYYVVTGVSLVASLFLAAFNFSSQVSLLGTPLRLFRIMEPVVADLAIIVIALRAVTEQCVYMAMCRPRMKPGALPRKGDPYKKPLFAIACVAAVFMLANLVVPVVLSLEGEIHHEQRADWQRAVMITEGISTGIVFVCGMAFALLYRKDERNAGLYLKIGVSAIVFALVYIIGDFVPINSIVPPKNPLAAQVASDVYRTAVEMAGLLGFTLFVGLDRKVNGYLRRIDEEREERLSAENYSI